MSRYDETKRIKLETFTQIGRELLVNTKQALFGKSQPIELPRKHRPKYSLFILAAILLLIGMLVIFSIAPGQAWRNEMGETYFVFRQFLYLVVGLAAFFIASRVNLNIWNKIAVVLLITAFLMCLVLAVAGLADLGIAVNANGAYRWLSLGPIGTIQPAEFMKFAMVIFSASYLARSAQMGTIDSLSKTIAPLVIITILSLVFIVVFQSDLSSGAVLIAIILSQLILSNMRWRNIMIFLVPLLVGAAAAIAVAPYRLGRITTFLEAGSADQWDQISLSLMSLGSGGLFGKGLGQSVGGFGWVPEALNDAIFPIIGETFGFVGIFVILIIFLSLIIRILSLANYLPDMFLRLVAAGAGAWILAQSVINIGAMTGVLPVTGITLPFLSFGGSSILFLMLMLGVVFAVSRYTSHRKINTEKEGFGREDPVRWRRVGGSRYTSRRSG